MENVRNKKIVPI